MGVVRSLSIETSKKLEPYKGIKKKNDGLSKFFVDLEFNKKTPKYNYHSGLVAGMLVDNLVILKPILEEGKKIDADLAQKILSKIIPMAESLVKDYNWKFYDLNNLVHQFFGDSG